ncbi:Motile sperm domain-containing protein 2 [Sarcoptes scabiei]|nr:Motile sperm domain-containing protein 2 [Sarcoptes scabiei]
MKYFNLIVGAGRCNIELFTSIPMPIFVFGKHLLAVIRFPFDEYQRALKRRNLKEKEKEEAKKNHMINQSLNQSTWIFVFNKASLESIYSKHLKWFDINKHR